MSGTLYVDNSNVVELQGLTNSISQLADTGATVGVTVTDLSGTPLAGETWPVSMVHAALGTYRATLSPAVVLEPNRPYVVVVEAVGSTAGEVGKWNCQVFAETRACS